MSVIFPEVCSAHQSFITLTAEEVLHILESIVAPVDGVVLERIQLNRERYLAELRTFLVQ